MRKAAMPILPVKFILFCLIAVICLGTMPGSAASNPGSSRMVNVADGVSLRVTEGGKAGGEPALVFIPGWSTGADIWNHQIDTFAKTHRVIAIDPRSQGESTKTTTGNTPKTRARRHDKKPVATSRAASSIFTELMNAEQRSAEADLSRPDLRYLVVPVPLMSNGAAASDCSELPSSRRRRTGVCWSLPPKNVDRPVIEYMPAPGLIPRSLALVVRVTVHGPVGGGVAKHVPPTVAGRVGLYSSDVIVALRLFIIPASPPGAPFGGLSR